MKTFFWHSLAWKAVLLLQGVLIFLNHPHVWALSPVWDNKYFATKLTIISLYQKSFINNNIVNKIKCLYWFNYKIIIGSSRKTSKCYLNFNLNQIHFWWINYNQYIQNKIKNKLSMKAINYACSRLEQKATRNVKENKNNFMSFIGD